MEGVECRGGTALIDEIPDADKDIDPVMDDAKSLVAVLRTLRQILNVQGT